MKSITFYITILIIKLKGIKKEFSKTQIDYVKLRAGDVHTPSKANILNLESRSFTVLGSIVTEILPADIRSKEVILYCPGGSFVSGPASFNWKSIAQIATDTGRKAYLVDYPKAPECKIEELNANIDAVYQYALKTHGAEHIILLGGSVGGTLATLLVQRLIKRGQPLPKKLVLITPLIDCSMTNDRITSIERDDPMYSRNGVLSAKRMVAGTLGLANSVISPLYGGVKDFPPTLVFIAENDIARPDAELFCERLKKENTDLTVTYGKGMPHIWPLLPIMTEAKHALGLISEYINRA